VPARAVPGGTGPVPGRSAGSRPCGVRVPAVPGSRAARTPSVPRPPASAHISQCAGGLAG
jgi:hypothetical protein